MTDDLTPFSFGDLFERLDNARQSLGKSQELSTEYYERQIAKEAEHIGEVVDGILVALREHFACHDCNIPEHYHDLPEVASTVPGGMVTLSGGVHPVKPKGEATHEESSTVRDPGPAVGHVDDSGG